MSNSTEFHSSRNKFLKNPYFRGQISINVHLTEMVNTLYTYFFWGLQQRLCKDNFRHLAVFQQNKPKNAKFFFRFSPREKIQCHHWFSFGSTTKIFHQCFESNVVWWKICLFHHLFGKRLTFCLGDHPFKTSANLSNFWPPPTVCWNRVLRGHFLEIQM